MPTDVLAPLAQFGAAGLIGAMWLLERRSAATRERQIAEAHERLLRQREQLGVLVEVVRENARALAALEAGHRALAGAIDRLTLRLGGAAAERRAAGEPSGTRG